MVGSLIILSCITFANMRKGVLLHKLILLELVLGYWQGFFIFFHPPIYAWWLSVAAIPLNMSWSLHNVIAWIKIKPFLSKPVSYIFIGTVILVQPYWVVEIYANFTYFHNVNRVFLKTRPWEALCRDPWWVATTIFLFYSIKTKYDLPIRDIVRISPRFAVMLAAMLLSIAFIVLDVLSVTAVLKNSLPVGINPFWKLSFVFKCLTDTVVLDDFKTALDRLRAFKQSKLGSFAVDGTDRRSKKHEQQLQNANSWAEPVEGSGPAVPAMPSPDGDYVQPKWEEIKISSHHLEEKPRNASRDRDDDANEVDAVDFETQREPSQAPLVNGHDSWPSANTGLAGEDYADAVRQMTNDMAEDSHRRDVESSIGTAR